MELYLTYFPYLEFNLLGNLFEINKNLLQNKWIEINRNLMSTDKAFANSIIHWTVGSGDTGMGKVERMSFLDVGFAHFIFRK
jgi:hypothetical protein